MKKILKTAFIETKIGQMLTMSDEEALYLLMFVEGKKPEKVISQLMIEFSSNLTQGLTPPIASIKEELKSYFDGTLQAFKTPIHLFGTPFQEAVWHKLMDVPYGETRSYAQLACAISNQKAYRAVANANGSNRFAIIVPCHRIINSNGTLGGYAGGVQRKQWLLDHEYAV